MAHGCLPVLTPFGEQELAREKPWRPATIFFRSDRAMNYTLEVQQTTVEGMQLDGAIVKDIDHYGVAEDGKTLTCIVELTDGRLAMFSFCPGAPISAHVVT